MQFGCSLSGTNLLQQGRFSWIASFHDASHYTSKIVHYESSGFRKTYNIMGSCWRIPRLRMLVTPALSCPCLTNQGSANTLLVPTTRRLGYGSMRTATRAVSNRASCSVQVSKERTGTKVHVVAEAFFPQWLEEQPVSRRSWLQSIGYEPSKHVTVALPGNPPTVGDLAWSESHDSPLLTTSEAWIW